MDNIKLHFRHVFFLLMSAIPGGSSILYLSVPFWMIFGRTLLLYSFILGGWFSSFVNPAFSESASYDALMKWVPVFAMLAFSALRIFRDSCISRPILWLVAFFWWVLLSSFFSSESFLISFLKLFSFCSFVASSIVVFSKPAYGWTFERFLFLLIGFYKFILVASLLMLMLGLGYERNGHGFQGVIQHPQAFGITLSPLVVAMAAANIDKLMKLNPKISAWVLGGLIFVVMSESRTAILSLILGFFTLFFLFFKSQKKRGLIYAAVLAPIFVVGLSLMQLDEGKGMKFSSEIEDIAFKGYEAESLGEGFYLSRGHILEGSFANIKDNWFLGIGFGIPSNKDLSGAVYDPVFGLPISLTVEKGVALVALFEEAGLPGFIIFILFLMSLFKAMLKASNYIVAIPVLVAILSVNIGEAVLFSVGGVGFFHWLIISGLLLSNEVKR